MNSSWLSAVLAFVLAGQAYGQDCPQCRAADCEHLCVTDAPGKCTAVKTSFGCFTHVDAGRIVGRVCVE